MIRTVTANETAIPPIRPSMVLFGLTAASGVRPAIRPITSPPTSYPTVAITAASIMPTPFTSFSIKPTNEPIIPIYRTPNIVTEMFSIGASRSTPVKYHRKVNRSVRRRTSGTAASKRQYAPRFKAATATIPNREAG